MDFPLHIALILALTSATDAAPCSVEWVIDWNREAPDLTSEPFSTPGVILPGDPSVTVSLVLQNIARLWNAKSFQEISGLICVWYGPYIYMMSGDDVIRDECNAVVSALRRGENKDLNQLCTTAFAMSGLETVISLTASHKASECAAFDDEPDDSFACTVETKLAENALDVVGRISRLAFSVLDWLGPSPFSGDVFGLCSGVRMLLGMQKEDIESEIESLINLALADVLKYVNEFEICNELPEETEEALNILLFPEGHEGLCAFLSDDPSRDAYLDTAGIILEALNSILVNQDQCVSVIRFAAQMIDESIPISLMIGYNITEDDGIDQLCTQVTTSFAEDGQYTPTSYSYTFPGNETIYNWGLFSQPGEILPEFSISDLLALVGAIFRSETLTEGGDLVCDVFQSFLTTMAEGTDTATYIGDLCDAFNTDNPADIEYICREILVPAEHDSSPPSLRIPTIAHVAVTGVDMIQELIELEMITIEDVCSAVDNFYHSENNLQSVFRAVLQAYLTEALPIADGFCVDYENIMASLESRSDMDTEEFSTMSDIISDAILAFWGISDRNELCTKINNGIDLATGRAEPVVVSQFTDESLRFLTDSKRCSDVIAALEPLIPAEELGGSLDEIAYHITGFETIEDTCANLSLYFNAAATCSGTDVLMSTPMMIALLAVMAAMLLHI